MLFRAGLGRAQRTPRAAPPPLPSYLSVVPLRPSSPEVLSQPSGRGQPRAAQSAALPEVPESPERSAGKQLCCVEPSPRPGPSVRVPVPPVLRREVAVWVSGEGRRAGEVGKGVRVLGVGGGRPAAPAPLPASPALGCYAVSMAAASSDSTFTLV